MSNDPDYTREVYDVEAVDRWDIKAVYDVIKKVTDLLAVEEASFKIKRV